MSAFENPAVDADQAQAALRALAHATRCSEDPREIYSVLGSLTAAVASLSQSLHQLAAVHDRPGREGTGKEGTGRGVWVAEYTPASRAARYQVSWELHRAAEILNHVGESIASAHAAEAGITYVHRDFPAFADAPNRSTDRGLSL